jgi:hypothetical protein
VYWCFDSFGISNLPFGGGVWCTVILQSGDMIRCCTHTHTHTHTHTVLYPILISQQMSLFIQYPVSRTVRNATLYGYCESNPRTPIVQPVAQRYTDWARVLTEYNSRTLLLLQPSLSCRDKPKNILVHGRDQPGLLLAYVSMHGLMSTLTSAPLAVVKAGIHTVDGKACGWDFKF